MVEEDGEKNIGLSAGASHARFDGACGLRRGKNCSIDGSRVLFLRREQKDRDYPEKN